MIDGSFMLIVMTEMVKEMGTSKAVQVMVICRTTSSSMAVELVLQLYYALACVIQYSRKGLL